jgi:uncharacterized protein (DUF1778 family)
MLTIEKARFDARLPKEQKDFFEYAASIGGYRTVTEFIISSAQKQANKIIENHNNILASNKDRKVFFDALLNPEKPNDKLKSAMKNYNVFFGKK